MSCIDTGSPTERQPRCLAVYEVEMLQHRTFLFFYCGVLGSNIGPEMRYFDISFWYSSLIVDNLRIKLCQFRLLSLPLYYINH
jgi:hypothetical protein